MISFQEMVNQLTQYWMNQGCVVHQAYDLETGAGTFNPATFLRCLGPENYKAVYVEPTRRPTDGRYGKNPNRVQLFHQLQVLIKPSPPDIQQLYLKSLEAVGLNLKEHDIRFVHDDWEAPTQGAWGLGWEVWIDGMEATQFTYFQAVGGCPLKPISVELAYGLERLAMFIQNVDSIFDVLWNEHLTFGDLMIQNEEQWSAYNFEKANPSMWKRHFEDFEKEAKTLIETDLVIPAYDFTIKASHAFNMLDARGMISPTERTGYIARVRDLSQAIAESYIQSRQKLDFPLKQESKPTKKFELTLDDKLLKNLDKKDTLLLEIGSEQLPSSYVERGLKSLEASMISLLKDNDLKHGQVKVYGTPRRLSIIIEDLARSSNAKEIERKGPATQSAFGSDGHPTLQGRGFLKSIGHEEAGLQEIREGSIPGLEIRTIKDQDYLFAHFREDGKAAAAILQTELPKLIAKLHFPKKMRWANDTIEYPRPIHWITCLLGKNIVSFAYGPTLSDRISYGHSQIDPESFQIKDPSEYKDLLKKHFVLVDPDERKELILKQLTAIEKETNATALLKEQLLKEITHLVEWPQLAASTFDEAFLTAPREALVSEMAQHQRYFPLVDATGNLVNRFVITADNQPTETMIKGNQKVLTARLSDALFLYKQDQKVDLDTMNERLKTIVFQKDLGTMLDKVTRLEKHASLVAKAMNIEEPEKAVEAAHLCKADLASHLVNEFPDLQGIIGKHYALEQGHDPDIALAIEEHWMPRHDGASLPKSPLGQTLSLSDKIDNLLGYFSVGLKPTSSSDPYACRRITIGLLKILIENNHAIDLEELLKQASENFEKISDQVIEDVLDYITTRAKGVFEEKGFQKDEIEASLRGRINDPYDQFCKTQALHQFRSSDHFDHLFEVYKRAKGQLPEKTSGSINETLFQDASEKKLYGHLQTIQSDYTNALDEKNYTAAFDLLATLRPFLSELFNNVKILDEDPNIQKNRLNLIQNVFSFFDPLLDFSKIQT